MTTATFFIIVFSLWAGCCIGVFAMSLMHIAANADKETWR